MAHSTKNLVAASDLEFGAKASMKRASADSKVRPTLWLRRLCYSLVFLAFAAFIAFTGYQPARQIGPSNRMFVTVPPRTSYLQGEEQSKSTPRIHIEDVLNLDSREVLVLLRIPAVAEFPSKDRIECRFGDDRDRFAYTSPRALHRTHDDHAALLCAPPPTELVWNVTSLVLEVDQVQEIRATPERPLIQWSANNLVVYETFPTEDDVVVFVHGTRHSQKVDNSLEHLRSFRCVFNDEVETAVTSKAQEVFRCAHPPRNMISALSGKKITVKFHERQLPSVAYYKPREAREPAATTSRKLLQQARRHEVCACTMIYNQSKFLDEWVFYHSHLGVSKFFLYDNNSEDDLDATIASLNGRKFDVAKQPWPWVKTQEAGFSHCSLLARPECEWMLFIDVDEFFFPSRKYLTSRTKSHEAHESHLTRFIAAAVRDKPVGQIMTSCRNYGPSGLSSSPRQGVTQGYTCRTARTERQKSIVKLTAVATELANVVHHFSLRDGFRSVKVAPSVGVINHYKFQAWDEFRVKFHRRAATYVADWTEDRNHNSNDRVPNLGRRAVKPVDWEKRYCDVWDYGLRNYTRSVFGTFDDTSLHLLHLAWERTP